MLPPFRYAVHAIKRASQIYNNMAIAAINAPRRPVPVMAALLMALLEDCFAMDDVVAEPPVALDPAPVGEPVLVVIVVLE